MSKLLFVLRRIGEIVTLRSFTQPYSIMGVEYFLSGSDINPVD